MSKNTTNLDPMTLVLKLDLDMVKMYVYTKNEVLSFSSSKVITQTDRHIDRPKWNYYLSANADSKMYHYVKCLKVFS